MLRLLIDGVTCIQIFSSILINDIFLRFNSSMIGVFFFIEKSIMHDTITHNAIVNQN